MKKIFAFVLIVIICTFCLSCKKNVDKKKDSIINDMSTRDKISQMIMMACRSRDGENFISMKSEVSDLLNEYGFGGMILFAQNSVSNEQTFNLIKELQEANDNNGRPGLFVALDQEGGRITRLDEATTTLGNMALGATGSEEYTKEIGALIASEVDALGFNVDFAPVADINNNPNNPVIGTRSFSDDKEIVSKMVNAYLQGLKEYNVIGSLKHFPGHGDTATDSHTGLPLINKTLDELLDFELFPYIENINDIEMIMTAHIVYPQIEKDTYISKSTGELINIPATLSKTIITDVLRERLGYNGVVVTDALEMAAIAEHFDVLDVAKLAINAGVDILLMPVDISTNEGIENLKKYIDDVVKLVDNGTIDINKVNSAVKRILTLKEDHNLLESYPKKDIKNIDIVGSKAHHDKEWEITKHSITLVKNEGALPFKKEDKVLIVSTSTDQEVAINYALNLANRSDDVKNIDEVFSNGFSLDEYDKVLILSQMGNKNYLTSNDAKKIDSIIEKAKNGNLKVVILSTNLPYDVARFKEADALVLCYNPKVMTISPLEVEGQIKQYGPNVPCAIYMMFNESTYSAKLPIDINNLDSNNQFVDELFLNRGFGLEK